MSTADLDSFSVVTSTSSTRARIVSGDRSKFVALGAILFDGFLPEPQPGDDGKFSYEGELRRWWAFGGMNELTRPAPEVNLALVNSADGTRVSTFGKNKDAVQASAAANATGEVVVLLIDDVYVASGLARDDGPDVVAWRKEYAADDKKPAK